MQKDLTPLLVVAAALVDERGAILMHRRRLGGEHGGSWEFPGGKVEAGESLESALVREIEEELGVHLVAEDLKPVAFASGQMVIGSPSETIVILLYSCRVWTGELRCLEGEEIGWFCPDHLASLEMPPLDYPLAEQVVEAFKNNSI